MPRRKNITRRRHKKDKQSNLKAFFRGRLNHCRDCDIKHKCMRNPKSVEHSKGYGRQVSFLIDKSKNATHTDWMKVKVDSKKGNQIYSHRMSVVEPVFGNITFNKKLKRFSLRSKIKVNAQWMMFCLIQNIEKLANYGQLPA